MPVIALKSFYILNKHLSPQSLTSSQFVLSGIPYVPESCCVEGPKKDLAKCQGKTTLRGPPGHGPQNDDDRDTQVNEALFTEVSLPLIRQCYRPCANV